MAYNLENKLVITLASSALFDLSESDRIFREMGLEKYRKHQIENIAKPFPKGIAFEFIQRLLKINIENSDPLVEVIVLSKNDPDTGRRFFHSASYYGLDITRGAFLNGKTPFPYIKAFNSCLFLSGNENDVKLAVKNDNPAGLVLDSKCQSEDSHELRIAFDFDGVLADDESEAVFKKHHNINEFQSHETEKVDIPHNPGPLKRFLELIANIQSIEACREKEDSNYKRIIRTAVVTARNAPANERFVTTMNSWGIGIDETFFLGGIDKSRIMRVLKPHIFFDDQKSHLLSTSPFVPSVHIPFGIAND